MTQINLLPRKESATVDADRLSVLYGQLGEVAAEDIVCRAMEELALRLSHCERLYRQNHTDDLRKSARSLIAIADQVGMEKLSRIAKDVINCIDDSDRIAVAATLCRLIRVGEQSLTAIWDIQDLYI